MAFKDDKNLKLTQSKGTLGRSAELAGKKTQATAQVTTPPNAKTTVQTAAASKTGPQGIWSTFYFDGTGNNLTADVDLMKHSNVARLYRASLEDDPSQGRYSHYIPGIGTLFEEINDPGGTATGNGCGAMGEARLDKAMELLKADIQRATDKNCTINVALFGFSRGAALARAFARRIAALCVQSGGVWRIQPSRHPLRLYFMGLFDTVASVGLAMSTNNGGGVGLASAKAAMLLRYEPDDENSPLNIAFGEQAGADPASGIYDGHASWANNLRIPPMVGQCLHLVAAHEIRNSFPVDSVLQGYFYPSNCREMVFPGSHSDVGGGYAPGEGARGQKPGSMLSLMPLWTMFSEAKKAGVPLLKTLSTPMRQKDFGVDSESSAHSQALQNAYKAYLEAVKCSGKGVGETLLAHMKLYYKWRFLRIELNRKARKAGLQTADQKLLQSMEKSWAGAKKQQQGQMDARKKEKKQQELEILMILGVADYNGKPLTQEQLKRIDANKALAKLKQSEYLKAKARHDAVPGSGFAENVELYDEQLVDDAQMIRFFSKIPLSGNKLRPHYKALVEAYEDHFENDKPLKDERVIRFFEDYVHDSLAGFAGDATLPSDPRVIYMGGDDKLPYAMNGASGSPVSQVA
jgi:hypothetical protein